MKQLLSKCGIDCANCPSYHANIRTYEDRQRCSAGWYRYHGVLVTPPKIRLCAGCQAPDEREPVRYVNCYVRKCAVRNGVPTCAHCSAYPCEDVPKVSMPADFRQMVEERLSELVPEADYWMFIEPYEGMKHLDALHATLEPADILPMKRVSARPRITPFPNEIGLLAEERGAMQSLHHLLTQIETADDVSYARQHALGKWRKHLLRILWAFGLHGKLETPAGDCFVLDAADYLAQGINSYFSTLQKGIDRLRDHGIECTHLPQQADGWLTPTGALRKTGWRVTISVNESAGGRSVLDLLQTYVRKLETRHGKNAFRYFSAVDMRILTEGDTH